MERLFPEMSASQLQIYFIVNLLRCPDAAILFEQAKEIYTTWDPNLHFNQQKFYSEGKNCLPNQHFPDFERLSNPSFLSLPVLYAVYHHHHFLRYHLPLFNFNFNFNFSFNVVFIFPIPPSLPLHHHQHSSPTSPPASASAPSALQTPTHTKRPASSHICSCRGPHRQQARRSRP